MMYLALTESNLTDYYYISDNDYIKVTIKEENLKQVELKATVGEKDYTAIVENEEMGTPEGISQTDDVYYIPFSAMGSIFRKNNVTDCLIDKLSCTSLVFPCESFKSLVPTENPRNKILY